MDVLGVSSFGLKDAFKSRENSFDEKSCNSDFL